MDTKTNPGVGDGQSAIPPTEEIAITNIIDAEAKDEPAQEQITAPTEPESPIAPVKSSEDTSVISTQTSTLDHEPEQRKRHFRDFFSKMNPHYKRNRVIASFTSVFLVCGIVVLALIISGLAPWQLRKTKILSVAATDIKNGVIGENTHFIVKSEGGSVEGVRNAIYLEPAIDYDIAEIKAGSEYEIIPTSKLADNTLFNIDSVSGDVISYKWAFQTKNALSVSRIYPANGANYVSENSMVEFSFSYPNIEDVDKHFSITPEVPGKLEKLDYSWRFVPSSPLAADTTYEITITAGLSYGDEIMAKDFHSSFSTFSHAVASSDVKSKGITLDDLSSFTENERPVIAFGYDDKESFYNSSKVAVEQVVNPDEYIKHLRGEQVETTSVGEYSFEKIDDGTNREKHAVLNQTLPSGYYILYFKSDEGQNLFMADVEVNNLAAYAFESERDALVWVAENGQLKQGVKVNYKGKDYETGENGLLSITDISDFSENLDYLKIGNNEQPLIIALKNFKNNIYPRGFIYTDRPLYNATDTIKVWGYVPLQFFKDTPKLNNFNVIFDNIKQQVTISSDGFFATEIALENYKDVTGDIILDYNDAQIASKSISVENYTLENYVYEFVTDKNFVNAGENINFSIKVTHVTGLPAINKDIVVTYDGHDYYGTTNGTGEASFSFPTERKEASWEYPSNNETTFFSVKSGGAEYNKYSTDKIFYVMKNDLVFKSSTNANDNTVTFTAKTLDLSKNGTMNYDYSGIDQADYSGAAMVRVYENRYQRSISGYHINEYTKENVPIYRIESQTSVIDESPAKFENGQLVYNYPTNYKDSEQDVYYSYSVAVGTADSTGRPAYSYATTYHIGNFLGEDNGGFGTDNVVYPFNLWYSPVSNYRYNSYRFGIKDTVGESPYSIGDNLKIGLYDHDSNTVKNAGSILAIEFKENIIDYKVFNSDTTDITFDKNLYPGVGIIGSYFVNGKFHRVAPNYGDYDEDDSKLEVKIETDKENYEPGDTVKAKVIITRPDGSRASGKVNLSVVNEAIFSGSEDNTAILASIYANKQFQSYSMSTYRDFGLEGGGGMGSAKGGRSNFGDTLFFDEKSFSNGEAEFEFKLNDSITAFRLTALAVENGDTINAGTGTHKISSYLPLSISTVMPKKVKNTDDLVLNATSIVSSGDKVDYTFTIEELERSLNASAAPGQSVAVNFGKLDLGKYTVTITGQDTAGNTDTMTYPIDVIETAQEVAIKNTAHIDNDFNIKPIKNPIVMELYDEITAKYVEYLDFLEAHRTIRLDTLVAYYKSLDYKNKYYNDTSTNAIPKFGAYMNTEGILRPLENAEGDLVLTALVNYYMPEYFELDIANYGIKIDDDRTTILKKLLVLASFKRPILVELSALSELELTPEERLLTAIAYAFVGDYDAAKLSYERIGDEATKKDLQAIASSFIDKNQTIELIDGLIDSDSSAEYLPFAIVSFFENNEVNLDDKSTVSVNVNGETEQIDIHPLDVVKKVYYSNDLADVKIHSGSDDVVATYYYQGKMSELDEKYSQDIVAYLDGNIIVGQTATLVLDISGLSSEERNGEVNIALPLSLKFSGTFKGENGLYLARNNNEYVKLSLSEQYTGNLVQIPLYVAATGNYELEPVVFTHDGEYHLSNNVIFDVK